MLVIEWMTREDRLEHGPYVTGAQHGTERKMTCAHRFAHELRQLDALPA